MPKLDFNRIPHGGTVFLAEGSSEHGFLETSIARLGASEQCAVFNVAGETHLPLVIKALASEALARDVRALGLMFDANADSSARIQSISGSLNQAGFSYDAQRCDDAGVYSNGDFSVGVFLSPGQGQPGRIEDLVLREIRTKPVYQCITSLCECVLADCARGIDEKGIVQTYISALDGSVCGIGVAFRRRILDASDAAYADVRRMLEALL